MGNNYFLLTVKYVVVPVVIIFVLGALIFTFWMKKYTSIMSENEKKIEGAESVVQEKREQVIGEMESLRKENEELKKMIHVLNERVERDNKHVLSQNHLLKTQIQKFDALETNLKQTFSHFNHTLVSSMKKGEVTGFEEVRERLERYIKETRLESSKSVEKLLKEININFGEVLTLENRGIEEKMDKLISSISELKKKGSSRDVTGAFDGQNSGNFKKIESLIESLRKEMENSHKEDVEKLVHKISDIQVASRQPISACYCNVKVLSFNLYEGGGPKDGERRQAILAWIKSNDFDIISLDELNGWDEMDLQEEALKWGHSFIVMLKVSTGYHLGLTSRFYADINLSPLILISFQKISNQCC